LELGEKVLTKKKSDYGSKEPTRNLPYGKVPILSGPFNRVGHRSLPGSATWKVPTIYITVQELEYAI
jgi:hypothetical protein